MLWLYLRHQDFPCSLENDCESQRRKWPIVSPQFLYFSHARHVRAICRSVPSKRVVILLTIHFFINVRSRVRSRILSKVHWGHLGAVVRRHGDVKSKRVCSRQNHAVDCSKVSQRKRQDLQKFARTCLRVNEGDSPCSTLTCWLCISSGAMESLCGQGADSVSCSRHVCANKIVRRMDSTTRPMACCGSLPPPGTLSG